MLLEALGINKPDNSECSSAKTLSAGIDSLGLSNFERQVSRAMQPPRRILMPELNDIKSKNVNSSNYVNRNSQILDLDSNMINNITKGKVKDIQAGIYGGVKLDNSQINNAKVIAATIIQTGQTKNKSPQEIHKAVVVALSTAMQESTLRNLDHGDRDSVGLFQQRPSCGWGSKEECQNPVYSAGKFAEKLYQSNYMDKSVTSAAQNVQRSAFPDAYAKWQNMAEDLASKMLS